MADRDAQIDAFLAGAGWGDADRTVLAGDASARRYIRITQDADGPAIVMDAPPDTCGPQDAFLRVAAHLAKIGLSPPACLAQAPELGLFLFEDLGDLVFARLIRHDPTLEKPLYAAATDALVQIQTHPYPGWLPRYGPAEMASAIRPVWHDYLGHDTEPSTDWLRLEQQLQAILTAQDMAPVFIHRDYHAENLIWLPDRTGVERLGLLDFQDAMAGHPAYDLASLLQDARRAVPEDLEDEMITRFARARRLPRPAFRAAYAAQAAQRQLRILGIFARLAARRGKPSYLALMPGVWGHLQRNLDHPALHPIAALVRDLVPEPRP